MSRCGYYEDDDDPLALGRWRAQVSSATRGKRGQKFFRDLIVALDALPDHRLIRNSLESAGGEVCALGAPGKHRGVKLDEIDIEDYDILGDTFDIAHQLAQETMFVNDEWGILGVTPEDRWVIVRDWASKQLAGQAEPVPT